MNIKLLGTGGGMPTPDRFLSAMNINYNGRNILIDCGESTQISIRKEHTGFRAIDIICLTHFHGDHILGLPGLLLTVKNSKRIRPVTIIGPKGLNEVIDGLRIVMPRLRYELNIIEMGEGNLFFNLSPEGLNLIEKEEDFREGVIISTMKVDHGDPCIGYSFYVPRQQKFDVEKAKLNKVPRQLWSKLQNGGSVIEDNKEYSPDMVLGEKREGIKLSYITDTRPMESMVEFIKRSKLFVCEGNYGANEHLEKAIENKHMTFAEAAQLAKDGEVEKLLLTHFSPSMENPKEYKSNATEIFPNTVIGHDGYEDTISFKE